MSSLPQQLEKKLNTAMETLVPAVGKASLFAITTPAAEGGGEEAVAVAAAPDAPVVPKRAPARRAATSIGRHKASASSGPTAEPELDRATPELLVKSTYLLGKTQDDKLRRMAVRQKLALDETMRIALQTYIEATGLNQDLTRLATCPIDNPAKSEPGMPRVHLRLRPDQVDILRQCRLLFGVEASEVLRRAVDLYYAQQVTP